MKLPNFSAYLPASPAGGPSKKFIFAVLIGLIIIIAAGFLIFTPAKKQETAKQELQINKLVISQEIAKDSDNDGLPDWEEALWRTNPNNPDTDKDGVPDGQEIKENRNPLLAGNGKTDKIQSPNPEKSAVTAATQEMQLPSTLTKAFGQEFFSEYLRLKQGSDGELSEYDKAELVNSMMSGLNNFEIKTNDYLESDIKIAPTNDEKTIKEYGNNLALIIKKYFDSLPETEMTIFARALQEEKKDELNKLEPIASAYRNTAKEIVALPTPSGFAKSHLKLANYFNNIAQEIGEMQRFFTDPMQATLTFRQYQTNAEEAYLVLLKLSTYFAENKVIFEENEPAEFFKIYVAAAIAQTK